MTDARDAAGADFSEMRLLHLLTGPAFTATAVLDQIETELHAHTGGDAFDDITLLAVRRDMSG